MGHHTLYSMSDSDSSEIEQHKSDSEPDSPDQESEEDDHRNKLGEPEPGPSAESCRPRRHGILPARFRDELSDDDDDGVICDLCSLKEPLDMAGGIVFLVDCDLCGVWVHTYCAFNKNAVSRKFKCKECSS